jgi:predicted kinase
MPQRVQTQGWRRVSEAGTVGPVSTVHMICGPLGAGKTTLARRLAEEHQALRFSLDEWVMQLFASEAPNPMAFEWWAERCKRCSERIWSICRQVLAKDVDVVLDFGFPSAAHREEYHRRAMQVGATVHLHIVTAGADLRWERVQARNRGESDTFALPVTEDMFVGSEAWWEPPSDAETAGAVTFHNAESRR